MCVSTLLAQADFTGISSIATVAAIVAVVTLGQLQKGKKSIMITDYRRGVRFVNGAAAGILGPGSYRFDSRKEQVNIVDMRPQPALIERLTLQDAVKTPVVISAACELRVEDPLLASTALRDHMKDSYAIFRDLVRTAASQQILQGAGDSREILAKTIDTAVNAELRKVGMLGSGLEITELWAGVPAMPMAGSSGVVQ
jgi:hypothetical protein